MKVSVIVPVYKAEFHICRCIDSILAQTMTDFEVLLIDDGSPDKSGEICDYYALKDSRVKVFHKENGGVSSARQKGMDEAQGDYVIHVDSDDWVEPNMLQELYSKAITEDADMVICDYYVNTKYGQRYLSQKPTSLTHNIVLRDLFQQLHGSCCNKLVKRACYISYGVEFPIAINYMEDFYVNVALLINPLSIVYVDHAFYHYVVGENIESLTSSIHKNSYMERLNLVDKLEPLLRNIYPFGLSILKVDIAIWLLETNIEKRRVVISYLYDFLTPKAFFKLTRARKIKLILGLILGAKSTAVHNIIAKGKFKLMCK